MRKSHDPITGFKDKIVGAGLASEEELKEIDKEVKKEVVSNFTCLKKSHNFLIKSRAFLFWKFASLTKV